LEKLDKFVKIIFMASNLEKYKNDLDKLIELCKLLRLGLGKETDKENFINYYKKNTMILKN